MAIFTHRTSSPPIRALANLDCEATWAGVALPPKVKTRLSAYGLLIGALVDEGVDVEVWTPAPIDPSRVLAPRGWIPPRMHVGEPAVADVVWAERDAKAVNDRRFALALAQANGWALPGARVIASVDELTALDGPWIVKAAWTSAGRDRCRGDGGPSVEQRTRITRLLAAFGPLVLEPWMDRVLDVGVCARVGADGGVTIEAPHGLRCDARGGFVGIELGEPALARDERGRLDAVADTVGHALFAAGYVGPFAIDAFVYRDRDGARRLHPLCEINARYTFGWVARALQRRLGVTRLGFDPAPAGATVLIAPGTDGVTAWCA